MRIVFAGTPAAAVPSLRALLASPHEVVGVITRPEARAGRGRRVTPSPVHEVAREAGIEVLTPPSPRDEVFQQRLAALSPDVCPVVAYGALIPSSVLQVPRHGWVNLHFSLLPAWRGAAPVQRAIMAGDEVTGASTFQIEAGLDTGPVFGSMTELIRPDDTAGTLMDRLSRLAAPLLVATVDAIADGRAIPVAQPVDGITLAPKIEVDEAGVRWATPAFAVDRHIRGCTPAPGAWTVLRGTRLKLGPVAARPAAEEPVATDDSGSALGTGVIEVTKRTVRVGTATTPVTLGTVQPAGKQPMAAADWARGMRIEPGERFGE
ncbi:MAG: methionyl-tRNA formyltransferase [Nostocoides sp.]